MRSGYCADIEWFIRSGASALGERGTSAAFENMLRFGPPTAGGIHETDLYSDAQVGWGPRCGREGLVARARRCAEIWHRLTMRSREVLMGRYDSRQWGPGVAGMLGELAGVVMVLVGSRHARARMRAANEALEAMASNAEPIDRANRSKAAQTNAAKAELEGRAQPVILPEDYECVLDACGGRKCTSRENQVRRGQWLREAAKELDAAHEEWELAGSAAASSWAEGTG